ncbi:ABC transporter ATP-binding protein [Gillisia hiemivivida]|uniref:ABC transporter ATP-binding protein n=1 Tax=Gillisia hiemivivida TaxID=291190 RepID=A0A5C6ZSN8_9FLAO|nr:ABC transporter ATP-binding protein [Gillisia hiemivivida]TXD92866.1 ABC transporter ATP-binding protein [Gillisia hiemivivida]
MDLLKRFIKRYFAGLSYFYSFLGYRIFVIVFLSVIVGLLDGLGLTMFLPLLQLVSESGTVNPDSLGRLRFLVDFFEVVNIPLNLISIFCLMLFLFFAKGLMLYISGIYKVNVQQWFIKKLRVSLVKGLNRLSYKFFANADFGRIQNTLTGEINKVSDAYSEYFTSFQYGILVFIYMVFAFFIDAQFAVLVSLGGFLTNFLYKNLYKNTKEASRKLTGENNVFENLIIQNVGNFKYLKATGTSDNYTNKLIDSTSRIEHSNKKIGKLEALLNAGREPILITVVVAVILIQITYFDSDLGPIIISLIIFYRALGYLVHLQIRWNKFLGTSGSLENMTKFGKELQANQEKRGNINFEEPIEIIELSNVFFNYGKTAILKDISFRINKKETIALVGESGSGKTTLVNIIAGLLPIDQGEFHINKIQTKDININNLQKKIGYITQDPVIFDDSLFNNISFWAEQTEENLERFWKAVNKAALSDFVTSLPEKENEKLGHSGIKLSGGQKQRISIARELYKDVEVLILDEATSALDSETEMAIQHNMDNLKGDYIIIIIAHRIATIKNADKIVIMKNGRISEIDSYNKLIRKSPYFKKMVQLQEI